MSIEDHLKPIGTLSKKSTLLDGDKIVIYPADYPLAPVGAEFTTVGDLNTSPEEAANEAMALAQHPTQYLHYTVIAQPTVISATTKKVLKVPPYLDGYKVVGLWLSTFANVATTDVSATLAVGGTPATKAATIAVGAQHSGSDGVGVQSEDGYVSLEAGDELTVVISAGGGGSGLEAVVMLDWFVE